MILLYRLAEIPRALTISLQVALMLWGSSHPGRAEDCKALMQQGTSLLDEQRFEPAQVAFLSATQRCPGLADAHKYLGLSYDQQGRFADAQAALQKAIRLNPNDAGAHNDLAVSYFRSGNAGAAVREFEATLHLDPTNVPASGNLAAFYISQRRFREAVERLLAAHAERSPDPLLLLELTQAYFGAGEHSKATAIATKLSQVAGLNSQMRFTLGLALAQNEEYQAALHEFLAIPDAMRDSAVYLNLGTVYGKLGRFTDAKDAFSRSIQHEPSNPEPFLQIGLNSLKTGSLDEALYWLGQAHEKGPTRTDITRALAEALIQAQQFDRARDLLVTARSQAPRDPLLLQALGDLEFSSHRDQEALEAYQQCLELDPRRVETHLAEARLYDRLNRTTEEKAAYGKVLAIDPKNPDAHAGLGHLALQSGSLDLATRELRSALNQDPNDLQANEDLAVVKLRQGAFDEALKLCEKLLAISPNNASYHYELGQALVKLGREEEAQREFTRSQELKAAARKTG